MRSPIAVVGLLLVGVQSFAQSSGASPAFERPTHRVGDTWSFRGVDGWTGSVLYTFTETIVTVTDTEITTKAGDRSNVWDHAWNALGSLDGETRKKAGTYRGSLAFPLAVDKKWEWRAEFVNRQGENLVYEPKARVVGFERVTVPAGAFDAVKVTATGYYSGWSAGSSRFQGSFDETYWYSAAAQRIVKYDFLNSNRTKYTIELTELKLAPR